MRRIIPMIMVECLKECGGGGGCWIAQFKTGYKHLKGAARQGHRAAVSTNINIVQIHRVNFIIIVSKIYL